MGLIHLPFLKGADQTVDPKIAPLGVLKSAKNVRFDREGRIVKRPGFDAHTILTQFSSNPMGTVRAVYARGAEKVAIGDMSVYSYSPTFDRWRDWNSISPWSAPERFAVGKNLKGRAIRPSVAYTNGRLCVVFEVVGSSSGVYAAIYDASNMALISFEQLKATNAKRPRVVAVGNRFLAAWLDSTGPNYIVTSYYDTSFPPSVSWTAPISATGVAVTSDYFDLCSYDSTRALLTQVDAGGMKIVRLTNVGSSAGWDTFAGSGVPTVFGDPAQDRAMVAWRTGAGALTVRSYVVSALALVAGSVVLDTDATYMGQPTVGLIGANTFRVSISQEDAVTALDQRVRTWSVTVSTLAATPDFDNGHAGLRIASKPLDIGGQRWFWGVNKSTFDRSYFLRFVTGNQPYSVAARGEALDAIDADSHVSECVTYTASGRTFAVWSAPVIVGDPTASSPTTSVALLRTEYNGTERLQGAVVGGNLYLAGGITSVFDGALAHEVGFLETPRFIIAGAGGGGSMAGSKTYQYLLTNHWVDANGLMHLSGVSDPVSATLAAGDSSVTLKWQHPKQSVRCARDWRDMTNAPDYRVHQYLWRTEGNGQIFHQLTDSPVATVQAGSAYGSIGTFVDTLADASIASKAVVYTQGVRGALSGPLQHDPPPPCRYIWAGRERAIIGGLETPGEVRWSKFYFPNEALEFSEDVAFRKLVPGTVRGVATLDDAYIVFTDTQTFVITGQGPDDTGSGAFDEPRALPSDVGLVTWRSLVEWAGGLFFQGRADMIYLLPRGLGSPQPVTATQEPLRLYPTVTSAKLVHEENLVVFTLTGGAGGTGALLVFNTQNGQWTLDEVAGQAQYASSAVVNGKLLLASSDGLHIDEENPASYSDRGTTFIPIYLETSALRPHGMQADGRTRKVAVLGEYRADCSLQMELSVDDSTSYAYVKTWALGSDTPGNPLRREWGLPVQKFGSCAIKIREIQTGSLKNEGMVLHGITLDTRARPGMPRLNPGRR